MLKLSSNVFGDFYNENNFPHNFLLTNTQDFRFRKAFSNISSANTKLLKTQKQKIRQSGGFFGRPSGPLLKTGLSLIGNVLKPLAKSISKPLGLIVAASATDATFHKKMFLSGMATLIVSNEQINDIMKIVEFLES